MIGEIFIIAGSIVGIFLRTPHWCSNRSLPRTGRKCAIGRFR